MVYTKEQFNRMEGDPALQRAYFWQVAQKAMLRSHVARARGDLAEAQAEASFSRCILDNIDRLVDDPLNHSEATE